MQQASQIPCILVAAAASSVASKNSLIVGAKMNLGSGDGSNSLCTYVRCVHAAALEVP